MKPFPTNFHLTQHVLLQHFACGKTKFDYWDLNFEKISHKTLYISTDELVLLCLVTGDFQ